jgi:hypothetical protein
VLINEPEVFRRVYKNLKKRFKKKADYLSLESLTKKLKKKGIFQRNISEIAVHLNENARVLVRFYHHNQEFTIYAFIKVEHYLKSLGDANYISGGIPILSYYINGDSDIKHYAYGTEMWKNFPLVSLWVGDFKDISEENPEFKNFFEDFLKSPEIIQLDKDMKSLLHKVSYILKMSLSPSSIGFILEAGQESLDI